MSEPTRKIPKPPPPPAKKQPPPKAPGSTSKVPGKNGQGNPETKSAEPTTRKPPKKSVPPPDDSAVGDPEGSEGEVRLLIERPPADLAAFYYAGSGYITRNSAGDFRPLNEKNVVARLNRMDKADDKVLGRIGIKVAGFTWLERIQDAFYAPWHGRLAGYPTGYYPDLHDEPFLVTSEARLVTPARGDCSVVWDFIGRLLRDDPYQVDVFWTWLRQALLERLYGIRMLRQGKKPNWMPNQALALVGDGNDGKTLAAKIILYVLDGLSAAAAQPIQSLMGETSFNEDVIERAVSHVDDDVPADVGTGALAKIREGIKKSAVVATVRVHGKGKKPFMVDTYRRTVICLNKTNVGALPSMTGGAGDKFIILKTLNAVDDELRQMEWHQRGELFASCIPSLMWKLLWEPAAFIPRIDEARRYLVESYKNADVIGDVTEKSSEGRLMEIIDRWLPTIANDGRWIGKSSEMFEFLTRSTGQGAEDEDGFMRNSDAKEVSNIVGRNRDKSFGRLLTTLTEMFPDRVKSWGKVLHARCYEITMPGHDISASRDAVAEALRGQEEAAAE